VAPVAPLALPPTPNTPIPGTSSSSADVVIIPEDPSRASARSTSKPPATTPDRPGVPPFIGSATRSRSGTASDRALSELRSQQLRKRRVTPRVNLDGMFVCLDSGHFVTAGRNQYIAWLTCSERVHHVRIHKGDESFRSNYRANALAGKLYESLMANT